MKLTALFKKQKTQAEETPAEGGSSADKSETVRHLDEIERIVYAALKPLGFRKHGRTLHRFTSGDVSQCVSFRCGQARREESHLMWVGLGIGVPECMARFFPPDAEPKKYYKDYECNIRADLGDAVGAERCFDLRDDPAKAAAVILRDLEETVLPVFDQLSSREDILAHRREHPQFDVMFDHLILLDEALIFRHLGEAEQAQDRFSRYVQGVRRESEAREAAGAPGMRGHLEYLGRLAEECGFSL